MKIRAVLMDIGGVVVGLDYEAVLSQVSRLSGLHPAHVRSRLEGNPDILLYETGRLSSRQFVRRISRTLGVELPIDRFETTWGSIFDLDSPDLVTLDLIRSLRRQVPVTALSNTNEMHFHYLRRHASVVHEFDDYVLSYEVGFAKPDLRIYDAALAQVRQPAEKVLFIDDRSENITAAESRGLQCHRFEGEQGLRDRLQELGIDL